MRQLLILIISFCSLTTYGQKSINWKNLVGNWKVEKEISIYKGDTTGVFKFDKTIIYTFDSNSKFIDKTSTENSVFCGTYSIDKGKMKISFSAVTQTTKFSDSKSKDIVVERDRPEIFVKKLTSDVFVYYSKGCDNVETEDCGSYTYLRKIK